MNRLLLFFCALAWVLVGCWALGIYVVSGMSGKEVEEVMPLDLWDKGLHFTAFAIGSFLLAAALRLAFGWPWKTIVPVAAAAISVFGFCDEWRQKYTKGRQGGDLGDWVADTIGGVAGAAVCALGARQFARKRGRGFRSSL
jgi:VanZ family protein